MNLVTLPQTLFVFYGALVLTCGVCLGVIVGRNWKRRDAITEPEPPEVLLRRVVNLEHELGQATSELQRVLDDRDFTRELRRPGARDVAA
jgi:hypothetical protein